MKSLEQNLQDISTIVAVKCINGTSFVGVRNYKNSKGEVSNQTFLVGINYANLLKADLETLKAFDLKPMLAKYKDNKEDVEKAYNELLTSLVKRTATELEKAILLESGDTTIVRSQAQQDAYTTIAKGLKSKDEQLYIYGMCVRKEVLVKGDYPTTNSRIKTIIKNDIKKQANLKEKYFKQFKLGELQTLKINGLEI
jgi:hypothetical protein